MRQSMMVVLRLAASTALLSSAGSAVASTASTQPFPAVAGQTVRVVYNPADGVLEGVSPVFVHWGINQWQNVPPDPVMSWNSVDQVWEIELDLPASAFQLDVVFNDGGGTWDNNGGSDWHFLVFAGVENEQWTIDGTLDDDAIEIANHDGNRLYAGIRGSLLYVAAPAASNGRDHFIYIAESPGFLRDAQWGKSGFVANWDAFIGNEGDNGYVGWFSATGATQLAVSSWIEATIDLEDEYGSIPSELSFAFGAFATEDGGALESQAPASLDGNFNINAGEYVAVLTDSLRVGCAAADLNRDCTVDGDDFLALVPCLNGPGVLGCVNADFDVDTDTDLLDVAEFQLLATGQPTLPPTKAEFVDTGVTRFFRGDVEAADLLPSLAFEQQPVGQFELTTMQPVEPIMLKSGNQEIAIIAVEPGTSLYGTGEVAGPLLRNGRSVVAWNSDSYGYGANTESLYQSHPWVLAVRPDGTAYGVLADTTYRTRIDLTQEIIFAAEGAEPYAVYIFEGPTPQEVITRLTDHIGRISMPPLWALGYQQSRYSYFPESRVRDLADEFRDRDIPCDVIWFDIDYMDGFRVFTFDSALFPNPLNLNTDLNADGFKAVWMINPGVKDEPGYFVYDSGTAGNHWVTDANGVPWTGEVWPGPVKFPDYTRPETRAWWADLYGDYMAQGIDGVWNDMNEPTSFVGPNRTLPLDAIHRGGGELLEGPHARYHNVYGMLMVKASREGILQANPDKRPFVLSRANYIGGHRYAATWTGDNITSWEHLYFTTPMALNLGLSGQPFTGPDIGGFIGDGSPELFARWMGVGAFMPFARGHSDNTGDDKEPWSYGPATENASRVALERRYRLMPYLYTLFEESTWNGLPVVRPVFFADPSDLSLRSEDVAFLLGSDLLVVPNVSENPGSAPQPALPGGIWRSVSLVGENAATDVNQPDLRVRGGSIVPLGPKMEYTNERPLSPLTLLIALDETGYAEGRLYEDAGDGFGYEVGLYREVMYRALLNDGVVAVSVERIGGVDATPVRNVEIRILTDSGEVTAIGSDADAGIVAAVSLP